VSGKNYYCGMSYYPSVYTKVSVVRDWIMFICGSKNMPNGITKAGATP
jgi:secreted trypsin-like serine protease